MFDPKVLDYIARVAEQNGLLVPALQAVCWVESAGVAYWTVGGKQVPAIRFEGHYFDKRLTGKKKEQARALGLAHPSAGKVPNPKSFSGRYDLLRRAMEIDANAALESISMGIGQVMGAHWKTLGYRSVQAMWEDAQTVEGQVRVMVAYIKQFNLDDELNARNWAGFAKGYNGPNYRKYNYDKQMAEAYKRLVAGHSTTDAKAARKEQVRWVQEKLNELGYGPLTKDGVLGEKTVAAVRRFQSDSALVVDGDPGTMTINEIHAQLAKRKEEAQKKNLPAVTTGLVGSGVAVTTVVDALGDAQDAASRAQGLLDTIGISGLVAGILVAAVAGYVVWTMVKKMKYSQPEVSTE